MDVWTRLGYVRDLNVWRLKLRGDTAHDALAKERIRALRRLLTGESEHPHDSDGRFAGGEENSEGDTPNDLSELLGKEHTDVKGQDAINKLLEEQNGHVKGAFERSDIGKIDLIWGNDELGLQHIIKRREDQGIDAKTFLSDLSEVIEKGYMKFNDETGNFEIWHNRKMAVVAPSFKNKKMTFLLTAFKRRKAPKN
jgi:hypothetical protein